MTTNSGAVPHSGPRRRATPSKVNTLPRRRSPATAYKRGRAFELRVRKHLEKLGYLVVRSYRSRGPFDLLAVKRGVCLLLQCKIAGHISPAAWNELYSVGLQYGATCVLAAREGRKLAYWIMSKPKTGQRSMLGAIARRIGEHHLGDYRAEASGAL